MFSPNNPVTEISDTPNNTRETYSEGNNIVTLGTTNEEDTELENNSGDDEGMISACSQNGANNTTNNPVTETSDTPTSKTRDTYSGGNNTVNLDSET